MKPVKTLLLACAALALPMGAAAHDIDSDSKRDVITDYDFKNFDKIEVAGVFLLDVKQGDRFSVRTEARDEEAEHLDVRLSGDTLILDTEDHQKNWNWAKNKRHNKGILAVITMPHLSELDVAGIATGHVEAFNGNDVEIEVAGIADLALAGTCDELSVDFAGMGEIDGRDLKCKDVDANMGGMGSLSVYASEKVDASMGGMGSIDVYGKPKDVRKDKSFFSSIDIK